MVVFVDYQNAYRRARDAFNVASSYTDGQFRPVALGLMLRGPDTGDRELKEVRMYRGLPSSKWDPKAYEATQRQLAEWQKSGPIVNRVRPLSYRDRQSPREKGIDVMLAVDFVSMAVNKEFDIGVIFSDDTDLHPAVEVVGELLGAGRCELAGWRDPNRDPRIPLSGGQHVYFHRLSQAHYEHLHDATDYTQRAPRKPRPPKRN